LVVKRNALVLQQRLATLGYQPTIHKRTARITRHRVLAGEFPDRAAADQTAHRLSAEGFTPTLVAGEHGQFAVEVGGAFTQNAAIDLARRLQQKHYSSKIVTTTAPTPVYAVRVGPYETTSEARQVVQALKGEGFNSLIVRR
jgi:cell division protein FtsN